jgi:hypothetical protein
MTTCPKCQREHKGPRDLTHLRTEAAHVLVRADQKPMREAADYLRFALLALARELSNHCADCIIVEVAAAQAQVVPVPPPEPADLPPNVIPLFGARRAARDLLNIGATFDSTRKP